MQFGRLAGVFARTVVLMIVRRVLGVLGSGPKPDADAVEISHAVAATIPSLEQKLGNNTTITTIFDQAPLIEQSIHDLAVEGLLGLAFAVLVILLFLFSLRATLITAISIPLSLLIAMIGLQLSEYSLNIFTLAALTVAVGRVVDDSIVVVENIKRRATGHRTLTTGDVVASVKEVAGAVTASTLTTVTVFAPVAIVSGVVGELFRPFAITVAVALGAIGEIAAEHRRDVHQAGVGAVDQVRLGIVEQPVLRQIENQQRPHAVVGEALPHFGEEEHVQALGMACEFRLFLDGDLRADGQENCQYEHGNRGDPVAFLP